MPQFDLYANPRGGAYPLLLDIQADVLAQLETRVVVPLTPRAQYARTPIARLTPLATIRGTEYVLVFPLLAALQKSVLGKAVGSLAAKRTELVAVLDLLVTGS